MCGTLFWKIWALSTILAKMCGTKCLFPELLQYSLAPPFTPPPPPPPRCNVGRLIGKPFLTNNIGGEGEGGKVGFGPKNVCFHVKNWSMVEAVHSASLSHIIVARIVGVNSIMSVYSMTAYIIYTIYLSLAIYICIILRTHIHHLSYSVLLRICA